MEGREGVSMVVPEAGTNECRNCSNPTTALLCEECEKWMAFADEVGIQLAEPGKLLGTYGLLDVIEAEWYAPEGGMDSVVELRIHTPTGCVLYLDMLLGWAAIADATEWYDRVDGRLVKHEFDLSKPEDAARLFGREEDSEEAE
jgi:hypothetical protein